LKGTEEVSLQNIPATCQRHTLLHTLLIQMYFTAWFIAAYANLE